MFQNVVVCILFIEHQGDARRCLFVFVSQEQEQEPQTLTVCWSHPRWIGDGFSFCLFYRRKINTLVVAEFAIVIHSSQDI